MVERDDSPPRHSSKPRGWSSAASSPGEWVVAALGLLILASTVGFLLYQALARPHVPPAIELNVDEVTEFVGGYRVSFTAHNIGTRTAANVTVEGRLLSATETVEASQVTLGYVPGRSSEGGGLFFTLDPRDHRLELRALGYEEP